LGASGRNTSGLTQKELSKRTGIAQGDISKLEKGNANPSIRTLQRLAAGMGKRLGELTKNNTKCMIKVNGVTLIERVLGQLDNLPLSRIVIVIGYEGQKLVDYIGTLCVNTPIVYVNNPIYDKTNNIY